MSTLAHTPVQRPNAVRPQRLGLLAASHWRIEPPFAPDAQALPERIEPAAAFAGAQARRVADRWAGLEFDHLVCTSCISPAFSGSPSRTSTFRRQVEAVSGLPLGAIIHAYECAGWGYLLRFLVEHTQARHVLISIVDVDLCDFGWTRFHPDIGRTGFGFTCLLLELPERWADTGVTDGPYPDSAFREFVRAMRSRRRPDGPPIFGPYLREDLRAIAERLVGAGALAPDRQDVYGHCYGSDGWISLIEWMQAKPGLDRETVTVGTLAYNGYFCLCSVDVDARTWVELKSFESSDTTIRRRAAMLGGLDHLPC